MPRELETWRASSRLRHADAARICGVGHTVRLQRLGSLDSAAREKVPTRRVLETGGPRLPPRRITPLTADGTRS